MRWQPVAVGAGLLLPPVVLAAAVWPDDAGVGGGGRTGDIEAELGPGDDDSAGTNGVGSVDYLVSGPGLVTIDVDAVGWDPTLTLVDADNGRQLDYNDDRGDGSLNSRLVIELDDDESVVAQVRSLGGPPGGQFTIAVSGGDGQAEEDGDDAEDGDHAEDAGEAVGEPFAVPLGDELITVEGAGLTIELHTDDTGSSCIDVFSESAGSGNCAPDLAGLARRSVFGGSSDGRSSTVQIGSLVGPEVASAVAVLPDGSEIELELVELPGRVEQVVVGQVRVGGDVFQRASAGIGVELRDADGEVLDTWAV